MNKKKNVSAPSQKPLPHKNLKNTPRTNLPQKKQQQRKIDRIQPQEKQRKKINNDNQIIKNRNPSKIPVKQKSQDLKLNENSSKNKNQKSLKELVQIQIFTDPTNIELTRKKQKLCEEQIKKQIEKTRNDLLMNSINGNEGTIESQCPSNELNDFSESIQENEKIRNFNDQLYSDIPICEEPFIADLKPGSLFDKSTVKTPIPGFSIRKNFNLNKIIPTFPDVQNVNSADMRLDSASEVIYPDGRRVFYNLNSNGN